MCLMHRLRLMRRMQVTLQTMASNQLLSLWDREWRWTWEHLREREGERRQFRGCLPVVSVESGHGGLVAMYPSPVARSVPGSAPMTTAM